MQKARYNIDRNKEDSKRRAQADGFFPKRKKKIRVAKRRARELENLLIETERSESHGRTTNWPFAAAHHV
jgi:hypothetical protein